MKYIILIIALFAGYKYYDENIKVVSSGVPIIDKIQTEAVSRQEAIDAVLPTLYGACAKLSKKEFTEECEHKLNYQKPFCIKMFNHRSPESFTIEEELIDKMASFTNCMIEKKVF